MNKILHVGLDVGSTTVKIIVLDDNQNLIYENYQRHFSDTKNTVCQVLSDFANKYPDYVYTIALTGSGAMSAAKFLDLPFIQEVVACKRAVEKYIPQTDVVIELGGEDAKIIYFGKSIEQRMNGTCAGGTGAFIDQMASLLNTDAAGLNELAKNYRNRIKFSQGLKPQITYVLQNATGMKMLKEVEEFLKTIDDFRIKENK